MREHPVCKSPVRSGRHGWKPNAVAFVSTRGKYVAIHYNLKQLFSMNSILILTAQCLYCQLNTAGWGPWPPSLQKQTYFPSVCFCRGKICLFSQANGPQPLENTHLNLRCTNCCSYSICIQVSYQYLTLTGCNYYLSLFITISPVEVTTSKQIIPEVKELEVNVPCDQKRC